MTSSTTSADDRLSTPASSSSHMTYPDKEEEIQLSSSSSSSSESNKTLDKRLWLGNLDPKLREYHLLKLVQKYGPIQQFDFLFHRSGPNIGMPRGYAFVEFKDKGDADTCLESLNGKRVLERCISVRWANQVSHEYQDEQEKMKAKLPALGAQQKNPAPVNPRPMTKEKTINAIEAKLQAMEKEKDELTLLLGTGGGSKSRPSSSRSSLSSASSSSSNLRISDMKYKKPYSR